MWLKAWFPEQMPVSVGDFKSLGVREMIGDTVTDPEFPPLSQLGRLTRLGLTEKLEDQAGRLRLSHRLVTEETQGK